MHRSAEQLEIYEQSRAEKSKVQTINLRVTSVQVAVESIREGSERRAYVQSQEQSTEIWGRPMTGGTGGRRSIWGNRKGSFDKMDEATRKCSIDETEGREFQGERTSEQCEMPLENMRISN